MYNFFLLFFLLLQVCSATVSFDQKKLEQKPSVDAVRTFFEGIDPKKLALLTKAKLALSHVVQEYLRVLAYRQPDKGISAHLLRGTLCGLTDGVCRVNELCDHLEKSEQYSLARRQLPDIVPSISALRKVLIGGFCGFSILSDSGIVGSASVVSHFSLYRLLSFLQPLATGFSGSIERTVLQRLLPVFLYMKYPIVGSNAGGFTSDDGFWCKNVLFSALDMCWAGSDNVAGGAIKLIGNKNVRTFRNVTFGLLDPGIPNFVFELAISSGVAAVSSQKKDRFSETCRSLVSFQANDLELLARHEVTGACELKGKDAYGESFKGILLNYATEKIVSFVIEKLLNLVAKPITTTCDAILARFCSGLHQSGLISSGTSTDIQQFVYLLRRVIQHSKSVNLAEKENSFVPLFYLGNVIGDPLLCSNWLVDDSASRILASAITTLILPKGSANQTTVVIGKLLRLFAASIFFYLYTRTHSWTCYPAPGRSPGPVIPQYS